MGVCSPAPRGNARRCDDYKTTAVCHTPVLPQTLIVACAGQQDKGRRQRAAIGSTATSASAVKADVDERETGAFKGGSWEGLLDL